MSTTTLYAQRGESWELLCYRAYTSVTESQVMALREANRALARNMTDFQ
ncbi:hypothetical protein HKA99_32715, partial [Vibrio parahaemolyticus]|nr:hypothetical protein [Vibrio parahaemolyticus]